MLSIPEVITGQERWQDDHSPVASLIEFYRAFNNRDLERMANNWSASAQAVMSNPLGGIKRGWSDIAAVYARIFNGPAQVYVEFYDYSLSVTEQMFCAIGRERGYVQWETQRIELAIRTTRIYRYDGGYAAQRTPGRWRQVHHHGSIDDAALLARYQAAVAGQPV